MSHYFDKDGTRLGLFEWAEKFEDREYSKVAFTEVGDVRVSTIWLGLDHSWGNGPPMIFETMIFGMEDDEMDEYQWRWSTAVQALAGHDQAVAMVREALVRRGC